MDEIEMGIFFREATFSANEQGVVGKALWGVNDQLTTLAGVGNLIQALPYAVGLQFLSVPARMASAQQSLK